MGYLVLQRIPFISAAPMFLTDGATTFLVLTWAKPVSVVLDICFKRKYIKYHVEKAC